VVHILSLPVDAQQGFSDVSERRQSLIGVVLVDEGISLHQREKSKIELEILLVFLNHQIAQLNQVSLNFESIAWLKGVPYQSEYRLVQSIKRVFACILIGVHSEFKALRFSTNVERMDKAVVGCCSYESSKKIQNIPNYSSKKSKKKIWLQIQHYILDVLSLLLGEPEGNLVCH